MFPIQRTSDLIRRHRICAALHKSWWKAEWIDGEAHIELRCERSGRIY
jgi:hypothetical protein